MADEQVQVVRAATTCTLTPTADVDASDVVPVLADQASLQVGSVVAAECLAQDDHASPRALDGLMLLEPPARVLGDTDVETVLFCTHTAAANAQGILPRRLAVCEVHQWQRVGPTRRDERSHRCTESRSRG